jgi:hypothetical protein
MHLKEILRQRLFEDLLPSLDLNSEREPGLTGVKTRAERSHSVRDSVLPPAEHFLFLFRASDRDIYASPA